MNNVQPPRTAGGAVELCVPGDWIDLLEDDPAQPDADAAARARFTELIATALPTAPPETVQAGVEALLAWRAHVSALGVVSHGLVNVPLDENGEATTEHPTRWAVWHILTAVVRLPPITPDLDLGEVLARLLGRQLDPETCYVESFPTDMGCGTGLLLQPELVPPESLDAEATRYGLAAAVSVAPGGGTGILVTGVCLDPDQLVALGALVAAVACRTTIGPAEPLRSPTDVAV